MSLNDHAEITGKQLLQYRANRCYTQSLLQRLFSLPSGCISAFERGLHTPHKEKIQIALGRVVRNNAVLRIDKRSLPTIMQWWCDKNNMNIDEFCRSCGITRQEYAQANRSSADPKVLEKITERINREKKLPDKSGKTPAIKSSARAALAEEEREKNKKQNNPIIYILAYLQRFYDEQEKRFEEIEKQNERMYRLLENRAKKSDETIANINARFEKLEKHENASIKEFTSQLRQNIMHLAKKEEEFNVAMQDISFAKNRMTYVMKTFDAMVSDVTRLCKGLGEPSSTMTTLGRK